MTRCRESSAGHQQGGARLVRLDERIQALKDADPVVSVVAELHGLLKTECFLAAAETERIPEPDTAVSLKEWWINGGGRGWLAPGQVPAPPALTSGKDANLNEVAADAIRELDRGLTAAFERWKVLTACRSGL